MKKLLSILALSGVLSILACSTAFGAATIDTSKATSGIIAVTSDTTAGTKVMVEKGGNKYVYSFKDSKTINVPLQMGDGDYTISVLESVGGNKYKPIASETVSVSNIDENAMYSSSTAIVNYDESSKAVPAYEGMAGGVTGQAKADAIYTDIITNYVYDFNKAATVQSDYVPVIDNTYSSKTGICYDYSALFAGSLRSQGMPSKLVMGYNPEISEYHAWNEVLIDGKWVVVDTTYDAQMQQNGGKYSFSKDKSKYQVVKEY